MNENTLRILIVFGAFAILFFFMVQSCESVRESRSQSKTIRGLDLPTVTEALSNRGYECTGPTPADSLTLATCQKSFAWGSITSRTRGESAEKLHEITTEAQLDGRNPEFALSEFQFVGSFFYLGAAPGDASQWISDHIADSLASKSFGAITYTLRGNGQRTLSIDADPFR